MIFLRQITLSLTVCLNVLLVFLSVFEDKVRVPVFLQVTGRLHPAVVHFPLVLLFVVILFEWLAGRRKPADAFAHEVVDYVLYFFALTAAVSALFGFFLYKEGSYSGDEIGLHRWLGTAVSILSALILMLKGKFQTRYYYGTLAITAVCLVITGHVGSEVTHGNGFVTEPIRRQQKGITIENPDSAVVFRDVIQPIFNEKCVNCHNASKAKDNLILTDYKDIMNGGEHRGAVVAGAAEKSLVYKYIRLPMSDTLHMPPEGKLQLDREEVKLIGWWINAGAREHEKYVLMKKVDSIHPFMVARFQPKRGLDLVDIPFADPSRIKALSNPYRTVSQISAVKPYIAVFLGSKKNFTTRDLTELSGIADQIVSIDLGNSTVSDADLNALAAFPHLQKLHLQNIPIHDAALEPLRDLRYLEMLNLSGTAISGKALQEISGWKNLKKLYIYNTFVDDASIESLKKASPQLEVFNTHLDLRDSLYNARLTVPVVKIDSPFFRGHATVDLKPSRGKVKYYYTVDGRDPTSASSLYKEPLQITQTILLKVIAVMEGWTDSKVAAYQFVKVGWMPDLIHLQTPPDPKLSAKADSVLVDGKAGSLDRNDKAYLAFVRMDLDVVFQAKAPVNLSQVAVSFLQDINQGVLPPGDLEVWGAIEKDKWKKLGKVSTVPSGNKSTEKGLVTLAFPVQEVRFVRVKAANAGVLPAGHPLLKTAKATIYVDEVTLN